MERMKMEMEMEKERLKLLSRILECAGKQWFSIEPIEEKLILTYIGDEESTQLLGAVPIARKPTNRLRLVRNMGEYFVYLGVIDSAYAGDRYSYWRKENRIYYVSHGRV